MTNLNSDKRMAFLAKKWQENTITEAEKREFDTWYNSFDNIYEVNSEETLEQAEKRLYKTIRTKAGIHKKKPKSKWYSIAAACVLLLGVSAAVFYPYQRTATKNTDYPTATASSEIVPGGNKATLILGNGKRISLTDIHIGEIANELGVKIDKAADGQIVYTVSDHTSEEVHTFNTIETPLGGQYQVNLPDGSKVWLNSASKLRYPVRFTDAERRIELTGEAYFEVAAQFEKGNPKNKKTPFIVQTAAQEVEVLGTHFNISAYEDDADIRTTLLEGSVRVSSYGKNGKENSKLLSPGQIAIHNLQNSDMLVSAANIRSIMAWKKGYFIFDNENIKDIMKKLSRWYDIEVAYQGKVDHIEFQANYMRSRSIENLLKTLELTNKVKFKIEGRRVTVIGESYK